MVTGYDGIWVIAKLGKRPPQIEGDDAGTSLRELLRHGMMIAALSVFVGVAESDDPLTALPRSGC